MKSYQIELMKLALLYDDVVNHCTEGIKQFGHSQELYDKRNEAIAGYAEAMVNLYKAIGGAGTARVMPDVELKSVVQIAEENNAGWFAGMDKRA